MRLDTHGATIIYVVDIRKGWNDVQCWRQVQKHQTHQKSYESDSPTQNLHSNTLHHYLSYTIYVVHVIILSLFRYFPSSYFSLFL